MPGETKENPIDLTFDDEPEVIDLTRDESEPPPPPYRTPTPAPRYHPYRRRFNLHPNFQTILRVGQLEYPIDALNLDLHYEDEVLHRLYLRLRNPQRRTRIVLDNPTVASNPRTLQLEDEEILPIPHPH